MRFDSQRREIDIFHDRYGKIAEGLQPVVCLRDLNEVYKEVRVSDFGSVTCGLEKHIDSVGLTVRFSDGPREELPYLTLRFVLDVRGVTIQTEGNSDPAYEYRLTGRLKLGENPETDLFSVSTNNRFSGIRSALGPASSPRNNALFNRRTDTMLVFRDVGRPRIRFDRSRNSYSFDVRSAGNERKSFRLELQENVYAQKYGVPYRPVNKSGVFKKPPAGFMTWYSLMFETRESPLLENVRIQKEKLAAYGADSVWVDWEWYHNDFFSGDDRCDIFTPDPSRYPRGLKPVAEAIEAVGFVPAVWIAPTTDVRENEFLKAQPEMLLFRGKFWCGEYFLDPSHPAFTNEFLPKVFKQLKDWGFQAVKWDALPRSLDFVDQNHDKLYDPTLSTEQIMRRAVQKAREILGDEIYMLSCHGESERDIAMAADWFDAARIGADIFGWEEFLTRCVDRLHRFYPLHNILLYADPDNVVLREEWNTLGQAVSRVSLVALLGTPLTIGDDLRRLPDERVNLLRRALPVCDIRPMEIEPGPPDPEMTAVCLYVNLPFEEYVVADYLNRTGDPVRKEIRFERDLDLEDNPAGYLVYDYWNRKFLGRFYRGFTVEPPPRSSVVLAVRPCLNRPQILSTSRHITQGACDLREVDWDDESHVLCGVSELTEGDPYEITFYVPAGYAPVSSNLRKAEENIFILSFEAGKARTERWTLHFEKQK